MARRKLTDEPAQPAEDSGSLESAMQELSQIVSRLESGQETLDASLASFERGMQLLRICHQRLDSAARRIELVTQLSPDAPVTTEPFDAASTLSRSADAEQRTRKSRAQPESDDSTLF